MVDSIKMMIGKRSTYKQSAQIEPIRGLFKISPPRIFSIMLMLIIFAFSIISVNSVTTYEQPYSLSNKLVHDNEINIINAWHLDDNRIIVDKVYESVSTPNNNKTLILPNGHFVKVIFEERLEAINDITMYAKSLDEDAFIEVYPDGFEEYIMTIGPFDSDSISRYRKILHNLTESEDTFYLRAVEGNIEIDYITDPPEEKPEIHEIKLYPQLNILHTSTYFMHVNITNTTSIDTAEVKILGVNGDESSCWQYFVNGTCLSKELTLNLNQKEGITWESLPFYFDSIYPRISFVERQIAHSNTALNVEIYRNNYHVFNITNPFTMDSNTSFLVELYVEPLNETNTSDLLVYLVGNDENVSYFESEWRYSNSTQFLGSISSNTTFDYTRTENSSYYVLPFTTNINGTIGKGVNITDHFWLVLFNDKSTIDNAWNLKYYNTTLCSNQNNWFIGEKSSDNWNSLTIHEGCPDAHFHIARREQIVDGINATVFVNNSVSGENTTHSKVFNFEELINLPPVQSKMITPLQGMYAGFINISWQPALDPNNDEINYNVSLLNIDKSFNQTIINSTTQTYYYWDSTVALDGTYDIKIEACDKYYACSNWTLSGTQSNFTIDNTPPLITVQSPEEKVYLTNTIWFNATADKEIANWIVNYNGTNVKHDINTTIFVEDGEHQLLIYANDTLGNVGLNNSITFTVDTVIPIITVNSPEARIYNTSDIWFNATADKEISEWIVNYNGTNVTHTIDTTLPVEDGDHNLIMYALDTSGNVGFNDDIAFSVDTNIPSVSIKRNTSSLYYLEDSINITWLAEDDREISSSIFNITYPNGTVLYTTSEPSGEVILTPENLTTIGEYNITLWANDTANNSNITNINFIVEEKELVVVAIKGISPSSISTNTLVRLASEISIEGISVPINQINNASLTITYLTNNTKTTITVDEGLQTSIGLIYYDYIFTSSGTYVLEWIMYYNDVKRTTTEIVSVSSTDTKLDTIDNTLNDMTDEVIDLLLDNRDSLVSILSDTNYMREFDSEQVFLITDSINSITQISEQLRNKSITPEEAFEQLSRIRVDLESPKSIQPSEEKTKDRLLPIRNMIEKLLRIDTLATITGLLFIIFLVLLSIVFISNGTRSYAGGASQYASPQKVVERYVTRESNGFSPGQITLFTYVVTLIKNKIKLIKQKRKYDSYITKNNRRLTEFMDFGYNAKHMKLIQLNLGNWVATSKTKRNHINTVYTRKPLYYILLSGIWIGFIKLLRLTTKNIRKIVRRYKTLDHEQKRTSAIKKKYESIGLVTKRVSIYHIIIKHIVLFIQNSKQLYLYKKLQKQNHRKLQQNAAIERTKKITANELFGKLEHEINNKYVYIENKSQYSKNATTHIKVKSNKLKRVFKGVIKLIIIGLLPFNKKLTTQHNKKNIVQSKKIQIHTMQSRYEEILPTSYFAKRNQQQIKSKRLIIFGILYRKTRSSIYWAINKYFAPIQNNIVPNIKQKANSTRYNKKSFTQKPYVKHTTFASKEKSLPRVHKNKQYRVPLYKALFIYIINRVERKGLENNAKKRKLQELKQSYNFENKIHTPHNMQKTIQKTKNNHNKIMQNISRIFKKTKSKSEKYNKNKQKLDEIKAAFTKDS